MSCAIRYLYKLEIWNAVSFDIPIEKRNPKPKVGKHLKRFAALDNSTVTNLA
jgi:hypothetical protein